MRLSSARSKLRKPLGMTPLIDVIFLLLLFFMLASSLNRYIPLDVSAGKGGVTGNVPPKLILRVLPGPVYRLNGTKLMTPQIALTLQNIEEKLENDKRVLVILHPDADVQGLATALEQIRLAEFHAQLVKGGRPRSEGR